MKMPNKLLAGLILVGLTLCAGSVQAGAGGNHAETIESHLQEGSVPSGSPEAIANTGVWSIVKHTLFRFLGIQSVFQDSVQEPEVSNVKSVEQTRLRHVIAIVVHDIGWNEDF